MLTIVWQELRPTGLNIWTFSHNFLGHFKRDIKHNEALIQARKEERQGRQSDCVVHKVYKQAKNTISFLQATTNVLTVSILAYVGIH